ncbi:hypothetical protein HUG10_04285 [Halorarum halophilum]|uniref:Uncharacterized protein n=1 Tax=Halorarum halophilum TaxID=2743090 RepID=A0A7D5KY70_9EURY|nr:hypothetical protein HUG10_04285 [Halobaculum halophilum]
MSTGVIAFKSITLVLGGIVTFLAFKAYRRTHATALGALALGFGFVTVGAMLAGMAHQAFGFATESVILIESALTAVGFGIIVYSLYSE